MPGAKGNAIMIESLMRSLACKDGMCRKKAREALVDLGVAAVPCLIDACENYGSEQVRWEAAKALSMMESISHPENFLTDPELIS